MSYSKMVEESLKYKDSDTFFATFESLSELSIAILAKKCNLFIVIGVEKAKLKIKINIKVKNAFIFIIQNH